MNRNMHINQNPHMKDYYPDSDELAEEVWQALFGLGPIPKRLAFNQAVKRLGDAQMIPESIFENENDLKRLMDSTFNTAVNYEFIDTPKPGFYRAVLKDPTDYEFNDWKRCITAGMGDTPMEREAVIRNAVNWARENLGLAQTKIQKNDETWRRIESVLNETIKDKTIKQTIFYGIERLQIVQ